VGKHYRYYVLIVLSIGSMFNIADRLIMSILMEDIKADFQLSDTQIGLLVGLAFALFYALMSFPIARWADRGNRKNILSIAMVLWSAMTALCGLATGFVSLFLARLGVGVGEAGGSPPSYSIIADYFKPSQRASAMGIWMAGAALGTGGGLMLGGYLGELIGWRKTFMVLGIPGVLFGMLIFFTVKEPTRGRYDEVDENASATPKENIGAALRSLLTNRVFVLNSISFSMLTMVGYAMAIWLAPIMLRNFDVGMAKVGTYLGLTYILAGLPAPMLGGMLTDWLVKRDVRWFAWLPLIALVVAVVLLWFCVTASSLPVFLFFFAAAYIAFMLPQGATSSVLQTSVGAEQRALAVAVALMVNSMVGAALGPYLIGALSDAYSAEYGIRSLNYALITVSIGAAIVGAAFYYLTARAMSTGLAGMATSKR